MPLPLLAMFAAGAGLLGGTQYLRAQADQEKAQNTFADLESLLPNTSLPPEAQMGILNRMHNMRRNSEVGPLSMFNDQSSSQAQSLLDFTMAADQQWRQQGAQIQAQQQAAMLQQQREMQQKALGLSEQEQTNYEQVMGDYQIVNPMYQRFLSAIDQNDSASIAMMAFNIMNILEPGGIVRDEERGMFRGFGGTGSTISNLLNEAQGKGLNAKSRQQLLDAVAAQYQPIHEQALRARDFMQRKVSDYQKLGYQVSSPVGSLGLDFGVEPRTAATAQTGMGGGTLSGTDGEATYQIPVPKGFTRQKPLVPGGVPPGGRRRERR